MSAGHQPRVGTELQRGGRPVGGRLQWKSRVCSVRAFSPGGRTIVARMKVRHNVRAVLFDGGQLVFLRRGWPGGTSYYTTVGGGVEATLTGGGFGTISPALEVTGSYGAGPDGSGAPNTWRAVAVNTSQTNQTLAAFAICARLSSPHK